MRTFAMPEISTRTEGAIRILTISNERKRNAFEGTMAADFLRLLNEAESDDAVRVIVVTGAGDIAFSSGHDLREMMHDRDDASDPNANAPFLMPATMTTPTIAAINGYAFAAGFILAISCDLRVVSANASFSAPGARIGLLPIGGQISRLSQLMPRAIAHEMLITCRQMKADEAHRLGFANHLVPDGQALHKSLEMARQIVANATTVVTAIKTGLEILANDGTAAAAEYEWRVGRQLQGEPDADEGMRAFLEKRAPNFA